MRISAFKNRTVSVLCAAAMAATMFGLTPAAAGAEDGMRAMASVTIYADAINGSDATGSRDEGKPFKSITAAAAASFDGDTVQLAPGTYSASATGEQWPIFMPAITLVGSGTGNTSVVGDADWTQDIFSENTMFLVQSQGTATFKDLAISNAGESAIQAMFTNLVCENVVFDKNYHDNSGGAIEFIGYDTGGETPAYELTVKNCRFTRNACYTNGGAVRMYYASGADISDCVFSDNETVNGGGGAIYTSAQDSEPIDIHNCLFYENYGYFDGSAIYLYDDQGVSVFNCTFADNGGERATVYDGDGTLTNAYNLIFWDNYDDFWNVEPVYSDYTDGPLDDPTNIDADPMFLDSANHDYHIPAGSPVIGAGINDETYPAPDKDLDGWRRPVDTGAVAMGAYENHTMVFNPIPGIGKPINIDEGQIISANPYTIEVYPYSGFGIERVEFYIDGVLIGTVYASGAVGGVFSLDWNTSIYHSQVLVRAFDNAGNQAEITRTTTVGLPFTGN